MADLRDVRQNISPDSSYTQMAQDIEPSEYQKPFIIPRKPVQKNANHHLYEALEGGENHVREQLKESPRPDLHGLKAEDSTGRLYKEAQPSPDGKWPTEPRQPRKWGLFTYAVLAWDICLTLIPLMFIVLGLCAASLDQKPISSFGENVAEGLRFSPTIFPIVFAAIAGRLMRCIAQWLAERGAKLGLLEQLVGSQNISSTVERMVMLKRYGFLSTIIVLLWCFSPLGGQSSLRTLSSRPSVIQSRRGVDYFNVDNIDGSTFYSSGTEVGGALNAVFQAALIASQDVQRSPVDPWGNVKVPMVDALSPWSLDDPSNPWVPVDANTSHAYYASLTGVMLSGVPDKGNSHFNIETSYMQVQCPDLKNISTFGNMSSNFPRGLSIHDAGWPFSGTPYGLNQGGPFSTREFFDGDVFDPGRFDPKLGRFVGGQYNILYGVLNEQGMVLFNCTIRVRNVEAGVKCQGTSCLIDKMRRSTLPNSDQTHTPPYGDGGEGRNQLFMNMCTFIDFSTGIIRGGNWAPLDYYVAGSDAPYVQDMTHSPDFANVSSATISQRLTTIFNTAWQVGLAPLGILQGSVAQGTQNYATNTTSALFSTELQLYITDKVFAAIFIATAILLQICAIIGLILKWRTTGPDILGYVSTQTRDNPFFANIVGGSTLDGLERARLLSDMKVQIGDVDSGEQVGHIAFRQVGGEDLQSIEDARVRKGRYYL
jgi:hypothetical protein